MATSEGVPFIQIGNRRALTDEQLTNYPELAAFVKRFIKCFERDERLSVWFFIEPE